MCCEQALVVAEAVTSLTVTAVYGRGRDVATRPCWTPSVLDTVLAGHRPCPAGHRPCWTLSVRFMTNVRHEESSRRRFSSPTGSTRRQRSQVAEF